MTNIATFSYIPSNGNLTYNFRSDPNDRNCYLSPAFSSPKEPNIKFCVQINKQIRSVYLQFDESTFSNAEESLKIKFKFTVKDQYTPSNNIEKTIEGEAKLPFTQSNMRNASYVNGFKSELHLGWDDCNYYSNSGYNQRITFEVTYSRIPQLTPLDHQKLVCSNLEAIRKRSKFADVTLITSEGHQFAAHKVLLSAQSSVFETMFSSGQFVENKSNTVKFENITKEVMEKLLRYIYSGDITGVKQHAVELLEAAHEYDIKHLVDESVRSMLANIQVENAAKLLFYSDLYELKELKAKVMDFICGTSKSVIKSEGWKQYVKIKPDLMEQLLERMAELRL